MNVRPWAILSVGIVIAIVVYATITRHPPAERSSAVLVQPPPHEATSSNIADALVGKSAEEGVALPPPRFTKPLIGERSPPPKPRRATIQLPPSKYEGQPDDSYAALDLTKAQEHAVRTEVRAMRTRIERLLRTPPVDKTQIRTEITRAQAETDARVKAIMGEEKFIQWEQQRAAEGADLATRGRTLQKTIDELKEERAEP